MLVNANRWLTQIAIMPFERSWDMNRKKIFGCLCTNSFIIKIIGKYKCSSVETGVSHNKFHFPVLWLTQGEITETEIKPHCNIRV